MKTRTLPALLPFALFPLVACMRVEHSRAQAASAPSEPARPQAPARPAEQATVIRVEPSQPAPGPQTDPLSPFEGRKERVSVHPSWPGTQTKATEKAVLDGLRWLARHQNENGSWSPKTLARRCRGETPCSARDKLWWKAVWTDHYDVGVTGLALLGFLGVGYTPDSTQDIADPLDGTRYEVGAVVGKGLRWLVERQKDDGWFSSDRSFIYNEAIATMALAEAYGLTHAEEWKVPAQKGVDFLQRAQRPSPSGEGLWGWRYASREDVLKSAGRELVDSDTSATGWAAMVLDSARASGLDVSKASIEGALAFTQWATGQNGLVGYIDPKGAGATITGPNDHFVYHTATMSAIGMCTRMFLRRDPDDPFLDLAAKRMVQDLPTVSRDKLSVDYEYWSWASLALSQLDGPDNPRRTGKYWGPWNKAMTEAVLALQDRTEDACSNGGWVVADRWSYTGGPIYTAAINVLTLEVYYRYANVFSKLPPKAQAPGRDVIDRQPLGFRLADERGKVVVLAFWTPLAKSYANDLAAGGETVAAYEGRPLTFAAVVYDPRSSPQAEPNDTPTWRGMKRMVVSSLDHPLLREHGVESFPTTLVIDADGVVRARDLTRDEAAALVERLVSEVESRPKPR